MFDISPKVIYSPAERKHGKNNIIADAIMTPFLYSYNSLSGSE
jgi:hypothetical protein